MQLEFRILKIGIEREKLGKYQKMQVEGCVSQPAWEIEMYIRVNVEAGHSVSSRKDQNANDR